MRVGARRALLFAGGIVAPPFPYTLTLDNFNRANEGPPPSASWTTPSSQGGLKVIGNACGSEVGFSGAAIWNTVFAANQEVQFKIGTVPVAGQHYTAVVRNQSATDWLNSYYAEFLNGTPALVYVWKYTGISELLIDGVELGGTMVTGMALGLRVVGSLLTVWRDGSQVTSVSDTSITGPGRLVVRVSHDPMTLDDLRGGAL